MIPPYFLSEILVQTALIVGQFWPILANLEINPTTVLNYTVFSKKQTKNMELGTRY